MKNASTSGARGSLGSPAGGGFAKRRCLLDPGEVGHLAAEAEALDAHDLAGVGEHGHRGILSGNLNELANGAHDECPRGASGELRG